MGIWGTLFNSGDTLGKTTDAIINAGDKIFYTAEEKAEMKFEYAKFFPNLLKGYEPFKIAQRILAIWFSFLFGLAFIVGLAMETFNIFIKYYALKNGIELSKIVLLDTQPLINIVSAFSIATIVLTIIGFYFFGGTIESFRRTKEDK